jgi:CheY-like chemotaxis protein
MSSAAKILLADDEHTFLHSTADLLRDQGYECDCAMDAQEATALLHQTEYDLIISDINMPGNGQLEFLNTVQSDQGGLPVIVITGYPSVETAVQSFRLSAVDYLQKPFDVDELFGLIDPAVQKGQLARKLRKTKEEMHSLIGTLESLESVGATHRFDSQEKLGSFAVSAYLDQAVNHLATVSSGLKSTIDTIKNGQVGEEPELNIGGVCLRCQSYREVLYHTIQVLMRTKDAFKSKSLGELRRKVEAVLEVP